MVGRTQADADIERYGGLLEEARRLRGVSLGRDAWRRLRRNRVAMAALGFLAALAIAAWLTPLLPLQPPRLDDTSRAFQPPRVWPWFTQSAAWIDKSHRIDEAALEVGFGELGPFNRLLVSMRAAVLGRWEMASLCGTDQLGRDVLARVFWGARTSLLVGLVAALVSLVIGVSYGAIAGYLGGRTDNFMMRLVDVLYSIPFVFVVIFLITILGEQSIKEQLEKLGINRITIFFMVVGAIYWLTMARVIRGQVKSLKEEQFVEAARTVGASRSRIVFVHLVPNLLSVIIVYLTLTIPRVMLFEAFLSFLGLGVEPPDVSWGMLANEGVTAITPVTNDWWLIVFPSLALAMTLFALNFLGDGLRDAFDPRLKNR